MPQSNDGDQGEERGTTMVEYALMASAIAMVAIASVSFVGERSAIAIDDVTNELAAVNNPRDGRPRR